MKKLLLIIALSFNLASVSLSQGTAGESAKYEYMYMIDIPTAGVLEKGFVSATIDVMRDGVIIGYLDVGVFENLSFGISYGGSNVIGSGNVSWYKLPSVNIRVRLLNELTLIPAITLGFDSQGKGRYFDDADRFLIKSPGFFAAASKNFELLGFLALHATANYSLENKDGDNFVNIMFGAEKTLGSKVSLILEYNFAFNDNQSDYGKGNGYLNAGIRWSIGNGFTLEFNLRDILTNSKINPSSAERGLKIEYIQAIF
ncbi:MAG: hypothetical protein PVF17_06940 [Ignavibacteria bacterium]|jgi:hypothetical protein